MANELELLTINAALDSWVDLVPDAISTGYQAQNTNIEGRTNGLEALYIETLGTDAIFNPSGVIDDNGAPMVVKTQVTLAVPSGQRFIRVIDSVDPTKRSLQLESAIGVYDESKNGYYTSGDRMLNWSLNDISGSLKSYKILAPLHAHILGDALFDGNITQSAGVTSLKATEVTGQITSSEKLIILKDGSDVLGAGGYFRCAGVTNATHTYIDQLSASGHRDFWIFTGTTWNRQYRLTRDGRHLFGPGAVDNGIDLAQFGSNTDISVSIARARIMGLSDVMAIGHYDMALNLNALAFQQYTTGTTVVNALTGRSVDINVNNANIGSFSGTAIDLLKPVTFSDRAVFESSVVNLPTTGNSLAIQYTSGDDAGFIQSRDWAGGIWKNLFLESGTLLLNNASGGAVLIGQPAPITGNKLEVGGDFSLTGNINPTTTPLSGTWVVADTGAAIPRGTYNIALNASGGSCSIIGFGGTIMSQTTLTSNTFSQEGGTIFSDGTLTIQLTGSSTISYTKY